MGHVGRHAPDRSQALGLNQTRLGTRSVGDVFGDHQDLAPPILPRAVVFRTFVAPVAGTERCDNQVDEPVGPVGLRALLIPLHGSFPRNVRGGCR